MMNQKAVTSELLCDDGVLDAELLPVFLMEADGILASVRATLSLMQAGRDNLLALVDLRKSFHALKGCCRIVGLGHWGGAVAVLEEFMKMWIAQGGADDAVHSALLVRAQHELQAWLSDIAARGMSQYHPGDLVASLKTVMMHLDMSMAPDSALPVNWGSLPQDESVEDALDPESLDIFLEEGRDLLRLIGDCLHRLQAMPEDATQLQSLLRTMHTIKGSSRMAGALRLGRHMHALETRIGEMTRQGALSSAMVEELLGRYDQGLQLFEALQQPASECVDGLAVAVSMSQPISVHSDIMATLEAGRLRNGSGKSSVRIPAGVLDKLLNQAGEISIARSGVETEVAHLQQCLGTLAANVVRLGGQLRQIEMQAEIRITASGQKLPVHQHFDPLEFDRYTQLQELTRMLAENVDDVAALQRQLTVSTEEVQNHLAQQARLTREMQRELMHTRMVQLSDVGDRLQRLVRQMAKETGKPLALEMRGGTVEIDRSILEKMVGPFEHLLRNAVVHGIESTAYRRAAGKDAVGHLCLQATQEGNEVMIRLADDGQGLKLHHVRATALRKGLIESGQVLSEAELTELIFHPGFSTSTAVTAMAGRGVGLDVVRTEVAALGGRITVESTAGSGAAFIIHLPLSLAVTHVVLLLCGGQTYAIPSLLVQQVVRLKTAECEQALRSAILEWQGRRLVLHRLSDLLGKPSHALAEGAMPVLVIKNGHDFIALLAERVVGSREVVTKSIGPQLTRFIGVVGATVLGNGSIVLILNPAQLMQRQDCRRQLRLPAPAMAEAQSKQIMVVDDSPTVRRVIQRLLKRAGYRVVAATDGVDALQRLQTTPPDLILVDIEMPRMDGFDLVRRLRDMEVGAALPIIMITSRTAAKHRARAMQLGVNEYLGKPCNEEVLLKLISSLTGTDPPGAISFPADALFLP